MRKIFAAAGAAVMLVAGLGATHGGIIGNPRIS